LYPFFCSHTRTFSHGLNSADKDENLQKKKEKQIIQALVNIFFSSNINITFEEEKKETIIQAHNMLAKSAHCANAMKRLCYIMILYKKKKY
jgi:hypothetical protein